MRYTVRISLAVVAVLIIGVYILHIPFRGGMQRLLSPIGTGVNQAAQIIEQQIYYASRSDLSADPELQAEINQLRTDTLELERLRDENRQLKEELSFVAASSRKAVTTEVVNYNTDHSRDMMRINAGSNQGIEAGAPVVAQSALVGKVSSVSATTSEVVLATDTTFRALALVNPDTEGVLKGQVGGGLVLDQLPRDTAIGKEDLVETSGLDGDYPPGILIGTVRSVASTPGGVLATAQVTPAVSPRDLHVVTVIITP